jgi:glyoxylase-like metal-dependent hydrolase (beta-lactamase superfamily II)
MAPRTAGLAPKFELADLLEGRGRRAQSRREAEPMIPFVREFTFDYGAAAQVSPLIRRVVAPNPGPFTFTGTGVYIVGHGQVAVIDPGPDLAPHLKALLAATAGETITHILTTHTHADHSPLARPLAARTGAVVVGRAAPDAGEAGIALDEAHGQPITGPGWTLEAIATPGHASNHVCYALIEENALFSGDHVMGWSTTVISPPDGDMTDYYASLDKIAARGFATLWPTHGPPVTRVAPFLAEYRLHRLAREAQILEQLRAGRGRINDMVAAIYADVDPRLHPAAAHSVLAHLIHLTRLGEVSCDGPPGPSSTFRIGG